jgi:hypothetical protein
MKKYVYIRQCVQSRSNLGVSLSIFYKRISETRQFVKNVGLFWLTVLEVGKSKIMATFLRGLWAASAHGGKGRVGRWVSKR